MSKLKRPPTLKMAPPGSHIVKRHAKISSSGIKYYEKAYIRKNRGKKVILLHENNYVEVKNNFLELKLSDLTDPVINIAAGIRWLSHKYYLLLAEKKAKPDDVYSMIKYYHSWDKDGETYANEIFKMYKESNNSFVPYRK